MIPKHLFAAREAAPAHEARCASVASVVHSSALLQTAAGCLVILLAIVLQLELFGFLSRRQLIPSAFSRKLTHIGAGTAMTTALVLFPIAYWPARLAVSLSLVAFMLLFAVVAHMPEHIVRGMPMVVRARLDALVHSMCRTGDREELMRGTFYYAFAVATFVLLFWTAPINVVIFASLFIGDGIADPIGRLSATWCAPGVSNGMGAGAVGAEKDEGGATASAPCDGKSGKPLTWLQYRVGWFGIKSYPGSVAFFCGALLAAALWGTLFAWAGHYGPDFELGSFLVAASLCIGAATIAEAISPPHVDNLLVTYAAAAVAFCLAESGYAPYMLHTCA